MPLDNFQRGDKAKQALEAVGYRDPAETKGMTIPTPDGGEAPGPEGYPISDLIADLMHLAQRDGFDAMHLIGEGIQHYGCDVVEQAFENDLDDAFTDVLQDKANIPAAERVLRAAGVPEDYDVDIFIKTGILGPKDR